jgi:hypothetical protein
VSIAGNLKKYYGKAVNRFSGNRAVYHHVPKCGGTSVARSLRMRYFLSQASINAASSVETLKQLYPGDSKADHYRRLRDFRESLLLYYLYSDVRWVSGHVRFSEVAQQLFSESYKFITVLREPVARYLSNYKYNYMRDSYSGTTLELEDYMDTFEGRMQGCLYAEYFSGLPADADYRSEHAISKARENLQKFDLVGFTHEMAEFARKSGELLGVSVSIGHENRGKIDTDAAISSIPGSTQDKLMEVCATDIEIYNYIRTWQAGR